MNAAMAQSVERVLGKDEVTGSIPVSSSITLRFVLRVIFKTVSDKPNIEVWRSW